MRMTIIYKYNYFVDNKSLYKNSLTQFFLFYGFVQVFVRRNFYIKKCINIKYFI
jgi:hypothetical protein